MKEYTFTISGNTYNVAINSISGDSANVTVNGVSYQVGIQNKALASIQECAPQQVPAQTQMSAAPVAPAAAAPVTAVTADNMKSVKAPLPGVIVDIKVKIGDVVKAGDVVAVLEAMKMENEIQAESDGTVTAVNVAQGDSVLEGTAIILYA